MTADIDQLTREALAQRNITPETPGWSPRMYETAAGHTEHAIRFTLSRYAPHELPDPVKELAERLVKEWADDDTLPSGNKSLAAFIIRRTREEDAKVAK